MPYNAINEEGFFFISIGTLCQRPPITCEPDMDVVAMARLMQDHEISGLVVVERDTPVGTLSTRDLRKLIASSGGTLAGYMVRDIMRPGIVTIRHRDHVFEAIFRMAQYDVHRLGVVDDEGKLVGVITDTDLLRIQTRTPLYLNQEIAAARSIADLKGLNVRMLEMVRFATRAGAVTKSLVQLISHLNDAFTLRIIALMENTEGIRLPDGAAYLVLGSEGRGEQTLRTDQDSAMIYADDFPPEKRGELGRFATRLSDALDEVGVPRCPGNTMASNPQWRHSLSEWKALLDQWIYVPKGEHMVNFGMFQDFRALYGDQGLERQLHDHLLATVKRHSLFFPYAARNIVRFPPPLGMFGRIRVERRGEHRGKVELKKAGIFAITEGVSLLALEAGIVGGSTWDKIERLREQGVLPAKDLELIDESFTYLVQLRLQRQLRALAAGNKPANTVDPLVMTDDERDRLREALKGVGTFLRMIRDRYKLDFISR
jgi:CBS domain-containing protein